MRRGTAGRTGRTQLDGDYFSRQSIPNHSLYLHIPTEQFHPQTILANQASQLTDPLHHVSGTQDPPAYHPLPGRRDRRIEACTPAHSHARLPHGTVQRRVRDGHRSLQAAASAGRSAGMLRRDVLRRAADVRHIVQARLPARVDELLLLAALLCLLSCGI